jgi:cation:H+ antiporter
VRGPIAAFASAAVLPLCWLAVHFGGLTHEPIPTALWSGAGIFGAAFMLSWAAEVAQLDISRALALAFLALVAVLPEYAVDVYFAWQAGKDPTYTAYATANMTGANRLLIGVGWAVPVLLVWMRTGERTLRLPREQAVEVNYLALATLYAFVIPAKGTLSLFDSVVFILIFGLYMRAAGATHHVEPELEGPAAMMAELGPARRRLAVLGVFAFAGLTIFSAAEPFAESLVATGRQYGIDEFLLVQWLAPLASESPEFIVAVLFTLRGVAAAGIGTLISSKVNQWTLLVGALPIAFALSAGSFAPMLLDVRQREEIFLTAAQSLFAIVVIANFEFSVIEALLLFGLFVPQFFWPEPEARLIEAGAYVALSAGMVAFSPATRRAVFELMPWSRARRQ